MERADRYKETIIRRASSEPSQGDLVRTIMVMGGIFIAKFV